MAKKVCVICNKELGLLSAKVAIADGVVCSKCLAEAKITTLTNPQGYNTASVTSLIERRKEVVGKFKPNKTVGGHLKIDEANRLFAVDNSLFEYSNLLSYELLEDGQTITKGGLGRAVAGGLLFGGVGAIVGGVTGGKKSKGVCNSMKLRVTFKDAPTDMVYINFITTETKTSSFIYKTSQDLAQQCISALEIIADSNKTAGAAVVASTSDADELMKFKQLLDAGVITQEEFDAKKKQLLGL